MSRDMKERRRVSKAHTQSIVEKERKITLLEERGFHRIRNPSPALFIMNIMHTLHFIYILMKFETPNPQPSHLY